MNGKFSVTMVVSSLQVGGAERVFTELANHWADAGHAIEIVLLSLEKPQFFLNDNIKIHHIYDMTSSHSKIIAVKKNLEKIFKLRNKFKTANTLNIISFGTETNILVSLSAIFLNKNVIISERCDPNFYPYSKIWRLLRSIYSITGVKIVGQTKEAVDFFRFKDSKYKHVIPNPFKKLKVGGSPSPFSSKTILAAGRLVHQKGFDVLIEACNLLFSKNSDWNVVILGEGPERKNLEQLISAYGLEEKIFLIGKKSNIADYYKFCDIFVLSSRFEGFPNVLGEAMYFGKPVISSDCPSGPAALIQDSENGLLFENENHEALFDKLNALVSSPHLRQKLSINSVISVKHYSLDRIAARWNVLLEY